MSNVITLKKKRNFVSEMMEPKQQGSWPKNDITESIHVHIWNGYCWIYYAPNINQMILINKKGMRCRHDFVLS